MAPTPRYIMYVGRRPITSDVDDHTKRPLMLHSDSRPTKPAAAAAVTLGKKSWIIGAACSRMPIPAVTWQNSTIHSSQNWRVLIAFVAVTLALVIIERSLCSRGVQPAGRQPSGGTRTAIAPSIIITK